MSECISTPISHLRLERYALGELSGAVKDEVAGHLAACQACREAFDAIVRDDARELAPLPRPAAKVFTLRRVTPALGALAAAAAVALFAFRAKDPTDRTKGGEVTFTLVREADDAIVEAGGAFREGERMKALLTCPPEMRASFELVFYDKSGASFPLPAADAIACGNGVSFPGAFRLSGRDATKVCLVWSERGAVDRVGLRGGPPMDPKHARCMDLTPAP